MRRPFIAAILMIFLAAACGQEKKQVEENEPPPPPTAEEIFGEFRGALQPFQQFMGKEVEIPHARMEEGIAKIQQIKNKHQAGENGTEGIRLAGDHVEQQLREASDIQAWHMVMFLYRALEILKPSATEFYETSRNLAEVKVNRPTVNISGMFEDHTTNTPFVFADVFFPPTKQTESVRLQPGDCWKTLHNDQQYEICLEEGIGTNTAKFRYVQTDETFTVRSRERE